MKRIIITFAITSLVLFPLLSQNVTIPDANFLAALIEEGVDTDEDGAISIAEAEAVTSLNVSVRDISDLTGIEAFVNLVNLNCEENSLTELDISTLSSLDELIGKDNQIQTLDVSNNTALTNIHCPKNQISTLDITNNIALKYLGLYQNPLENLDVSKNINLIALNLPGIQSLDVSNNPELFGLFIHFSNLTQLDLRSNTKLKHLTLNNCTDLREVCVWQMPFPPSDFVEFNITNCPNICYQTDCNGDCTVGIDETNLSELSIYPNPTNSIFTIETDQPDHHSIEIISLSGQLIYRTKMEGTSIQIDLSLFSKGIYFITLRSDAWVRTEKVVKY